MTKQTRRIYFIDNLRIFLTFLVVAHHWAIANGGPGDWYYAENNLSDFGSLLLSVFVATNQAFFMGFFFFISAFFVPVSFDKKGTRIFLKERLVRLGIPLVVYSFVISPVSMFLVRRFSQDYAGNFIHFILNENGIFSVGPLWFIALLLIFSFAYSVVRSVFAKKSLTFPFNKAYGVLLLVALVLITFLIRIFSPVGSWVPVLGLQPAHLAQYVLYFALGIAAYRQNIIEKLTLKSSKRWLALAQFLILVVFPALFLLTGETVNIDLFMGGKTYQSFLYVLWEQSVAVSMIIGLLGFFKHFYNRQSNLQKDLSQNSYAIYILHGLVLVPISLLLLSFSVNSMDKFLLLLLPAFVFCYLLAKFVRMSSIIRRVL
jgi:glucans biosynthesis protein C